MLTLLFQAAYSNCVSGSPTCSLCAREQGCSQCPAGYFLDYENCFPCVPSCQLCLYSIQCSRCYIGYFIDQQRRCTACQSLIQNCLYCSQVTGCFSCMAGFFPASGVCNKCDSKCATCLNDSSCAECQTSYYQSGDNCEPCAANCLTCFGSSSCTSCAVGAYFSQSCWPCSLECQTCQKSNLCTSCRAGYYLQINSCSQCESPCNECSQLGYCLACIPGYYLASGGGSCSLCSTITNCAICNSQSVCELCADGYFLDNDCKVCPQGCSRCFKSQVVKCSDCKLTYYLDNQRCVGCTSSCAFCDSLTCLKCSAGFILSSGVCTAGPGCSLSQGLNQFSLCSSCPQRCVTCQYSNNCLKCQPSLYLYSGVCSTCSQNCQTCSQFGCITCKPFYCLSNLRCSLCQLQNCKLSIDGSRCNLCIQGRYLGSLLGFRICLLCSRGVARCLDGRQISATSCLNFYYLVPRPGSKVGTCTPCSTGCYVCLTNTACNYCAVGYYLDANLCVACSLGCRSCDRNFCYSCVTGYFQSGGNYCSKCPARCMSCWSWAQCTSCSDGYFLSANQCLSCGNGFCSSNQLYHTCFFGYYLAANNAACNACPQPCVSCTPIGCFSCQRGNFLKGQQCVACKQNCLHCQSSSCLSCIPTFQLIKGDCVLLKSYIKPQLNRQTPKLINKSKVTYQEYYQIVYALFMALLLGAVFSLYLAHLWLDGIRRSEGRLEKYLREQLQKPQQCSKCGKQFKTGQLVLRLNCNHLLHSTCANPIRPLMCIYCNK